MRVCSGPAGPDNASSTAPPRRRTRRQVVVQDSGAAKGGLQPDRSVLEPPVRIFIRGIGPVPVQDCRASPASPGRSIPAAAAVSRISSAASRQSCGSLSVQEQIVRPNDSDNSPSASAAATCRCAAARRGHAVCPTAAPLVIRVLWISHARGL